MAATCECDTGGAAAGGVLVGALGAGAVAWWLTQRQPTAAAARRNSQTGRRGRSSPQASPRVAVPVEPGQAPVLNGQGAGKTHTRDPWLDLPELF